MALSARVPFPVVDAPVIDLTGDDTSISSETSAPAWRQADPEGDVADRPAKRVKLSQRGLTDIPDFATLLNKCIKEQVLPAVRAAVQRLPRANLNTTSLHRDILQFLTRNDFTQDFLRGNGRISAELEAQLGPRARAEAERLYRLPQYSLQNPNTNLASQPPPPPPSPNPPTPMNGSIPPPHVRPSPFPDLSAFAYQPPPPLQPSPFLEEHHSIRHSIEDQGIKPEDHETNGYHSDAEVDHWEPEYSGASDEDVVRAADIDLPSSPDTPAERPRRRFASHMTPRQKAQSHKLLHTSPHNFRSRARLLALQSEPHASSNTQRPIVTNSRYFSLTRRPYRSLQERTQVLRGSNRLYRIPSTTLHEPSVLHVDFSQAEAAYVLAVTKRFLGFDHDDQLAAGDLGKLLRKNRRAVPEILKKLDREILKGRTNGDISNFMVDALKRSLNTSPRMLTIERDDLDKHGQALRISRVSSLLLAREAAGCKGLLSSTRGFVNFANEFRKCREDGLELRTEWVGCAGDITTIAWTSKDCFVCGTTAHSDSRNQQYNKPGNLVLGSAALGTLRAYADHRVLRPIVGQGENSTEAMRQSQDPWLYSSVVSSAFDANHDRAYTSSFDKTVKIWKTTQDGSSMSCVGTWPHDGNVQFVVASKDASGMVATAADVPVGAVRVYHIDEDNLEASSYRSFSCSRIVDLEGNPILTEKWAYFPATIQWALAEGFRHLLLVGYSPRSLAAYEDEIPEDRRNSGEICLWDGLTGDRWKITSGTSQNVFEVAWHPTQPSFIAATSPVGLDVEDNVFTQIRIFRPSDNKAFDKAFAEVQVLDCAGVDINELTIIPNSFSYSYVTAGCTDGKVYVWDTARGQRPVHVLCHGPLIEESADGRNTDDTGVKFTAWGTSPDRLYTGSSDGVVKVWNVRSLRKPLVRDLLECPAQVSYGAFSPDFSRLVIGDASGRVHLLSVDADEEEEEEPPSATAAAATAPRFAQIRLPDGSTRTTRRPNPMIPHPEPPAPTHDADGNPVESSVDIGIRSAREYLWRGQLRLHRDRTVGAVQGERYAELGLWRRDAHFNEEPGAPLVASVDEAQQENRKMFTTGRRAARAVREVRDPLGAAARERHEANTGLDLEFEKLQLQTQLDLEVERAEVDERSVDYRFAYEEFPEGL